MGKVKYCRTDQLAVWIENKVSANPEEVSVLTILYDLREGNVPETDVIPTDFVREWFKEHYHTSANSLISDYNEYRKGN